MVFPQGTLLVEVDEDGTMVRLVSLAERRAVTGLYWTARTGTPLGRGIASMAARRLGEPPLMDDRHQRKR